MGINYAQIRFSTVVWRGAGMVRPICLEQDAIVQLMPLPPYHLLLH